MTLLLSSHGWVARPMWIVAYGLSLAAASGTLYFLSRLIFDGPPDIEESIVWILPLVVLGAGAAISIRNMRLCVPHAQNAVIAMELAYAANASLCLIAFRSDGWESGAYFTLVTFVLYIAHVTLVSLTPRAMSRY
jgi:hypothetical protein